MREREREGGREGGRERERETATLREHPKKEWFHAQHDIK